MGMGNGEHREAQDSTPLLPPAGEGCSRPHLLQQHVEQCTKNTKIEERTRQCPRKARIEDSTLMIRPEISSSVNAAALHAGPRLESELDNIAPITVIAIECASILEGGAQHTGTLPHTNQIIYVAWVH